MTAEAVDDTLVLAKHLVNDPSSISQLLKCRIAGIIRLKVPSHGALEAQVEGNQGVDGGDDRLDHSHGKSYRDAVGTLASADGVFLQHVTMLVEPRVAISRFVLESTPNTSATDVFGQGNDRPGGASLNRTRATIKASERPIH